MSDSLVKFSKNASGRDFVVGDVHGCLEQLNAALNDVHFNKEIDRVFFVGDLVDRGKHSYECLMMLLEPWAFSVRGNHEQMIADCFSGDDNMCVMSHRNGGEWIVDLTEEQVNNVIEVINQMPLAIEIDCGNRVVGIVHAEVPDHDWSLVNNLSMIGSLVDISEVDTCLWSREKVTSHNTNRVDGIDWVYVGHTPMQNVLTLGNVSYIDTGCVYGRELTILPLSS